MKDKKKERKKERKKKGRQDKEEQKLIYLLNVKAFVFSGEEIVEHFYFQLCKCNSSSVLCHHRQNLARKVNLVLRGIFEQSKSTSCNLAVGFSLQKLEET